MKYCSKCGKEIVDEAVICPGCGCAQGNNVQNNIANSNVQGNDVSQSKVNAWSILGFFIPVAGLILYLIWKDTEPEKAKAAGKGALAGVITYVVFCFVMGMIGGIVAVL